MRFSAAVLTLGMLASGCSTAVMDGPGDTDELGEGDGWTETQGSVAVERFTTHGSSTVVRTRVSARFVRVAGALDAAAAERLVGSPLHVAAGPERGCVFLDPAAGYDATQLEQGAVELVDVGDMLLVAGDMVMPLAPRAFPDVGDVISGVVYTSRDDSSDLPADASYLVETSGSALVEGFRARFDAPEALVDLTISGQRAPELEVVDATGFSLSWQPGSERDRIVVDVASLAAPEGQVLRCSFSDTGSATIGEPISAFAGDDVEITVHRHRHTLLADAHEALEPSGLDGAAVDFDFAVTARAFVTHSSD